MEFFKFAVAILLVESVNLYLVGCYSFQDQFNLAFLSLDLVIFCKGDNATGRFQIQNDFLALSCRKNKTRTNRQALHWLLLITMLIKSIRVRTTCIHGNTCNFE